MKITHFYLEALNKYLSETFRPLENLLVIIAINIITNSLAP